MSTDVPHDPSRCTRCGVCCMLDLRVNGRPFAVRELGCRHLVEEARGRYACAVYATRHQDTPWCLTIPQARAAGVLAADCPFRDPDDPRPAPAPLHPRLVRQLAPALRQTLAQAGLPPWLDAAALPPDLRAAPMTIDWGTDASSLVQRSVFLEDRLFSVAPDPIKVASIDDLAHPVATLPLVDGE